MSNMLDSNRNWKTRFFFVEGTDWVCCEEEWATMPYGYLTILGLMSKNQVKNVSYPFTCFILMFLTLSSFS